MEFSLIIPKAATAILKANPQAMKKCLGCTIACDDMTKFVCLGFNAQSIVNYLDRHPNFAEEVEKEFFVPFDFNSDDDDADIDYNLFDIDEDEEK